MIMISLKFLFVDFTKKMEFARKKTFACIDTQPVKESESIQRNLNLVRISKEAFAKWGNSASFRIYPHLLLYAKIICLVSVL